MSGQWNAENLQSLGSITPAAISLREAVETLNPKAKISMYAAGKKGSIAKRTWNGCAFNEAGKIEDQIVNSYSSAADVFELPHSTVTGFIGAWDSGVETTDDLIQIILEVGLYTEPGETKPKRRSGLNRVSFRKYTSWETRLREDLDFNIDHDLLPEGTQEAAELLFAGV